MAMPMLSLGGSGVERGRGWRAMLSPCSSEDREGGSGVERGRG